MSRRVVAAALALTVVGAACGDNSDDDPPAATATSGAPASTAPATPTGFVVQAGINDPKDPTIAVTEFLPEKISVKPGTTVTWTWTGTEPHSVTFNPDRKAPQPGPPDERLFAPTPGDVDTANALVNSGLVPLGPGPVPPFSQTFDNAGTFQYFCVIHPGMIGTVEVAASATETPAAIAARGKTEGDRFLAEGQAAKAKLVGTAPKSTPDAGGTTWTVEMGATTEHTDILAFAPTPATVKAGDTVTFVNNSGAPHTATFAGTQQVPQDPTSPEVAAPKPGPSPQTLNKTDLFNTGLLPPNSPPGAGPPLPARSFSFKVPAAGSYPYVCILHVPSNMTGAITAT